MGHQIVGIDNLNDYYEVSLKLARNSILQKNKDFYFEKANIANQEELNAVLSKYKAKKIIHLAAQAGVRKSLTDPFIYEESNIKGFLNILESAKKYKINQIVFASSSSVYGENKMNLGGFSEKDKVSKPISFYGGTKIANELMAYTYSHLYGINCTGLRFFTVYGPWGRPDMAYFKFTKAIIEGKPIDIYNKGEMKRDFTYIDDIVDGVIKAIDKEYTYEIFNLGNSLTVELLHFLKCLENLLNKQANINFMPLQPGDVLETYANIDHSKQKLGFNPTTKIEDGLKNFVKWYKDYYRI
jgi:UDP-glucuronate 4-epimerase